MNDNTLECNNPYKNLLIEVRPRLQSVNVFGSMKCTYENLQVTLHENSFEIIVDNATYKIDCPDFQIVLNSRSYVQHKNENLYFRFSTEPSDNLGSFKSEVLKLSNSNESSSSDNTFLETGQKYTIKCSNCKQTLCYDISFDRILPLPSEGANQNDWFCHAHSSSEFKNLDPKPRDIFYTHCYAHVNSNLISGVRNTNQNIICRRCLQWLGLSVNERTIKIWFNTTIFDNYKTSYRSNALDDSLLTIAKNVSENILTQNKILLNCQVSHTEVNYLMVWVIEKKLLIYVYNEDGRNKSEVSKILFKFVTQKDDLVNSWKESFELPDIAISKNMMVSLVKHLYDMNSSIPDEFSTAGDYYVSYVSMYNLLK